MIILDRAQSLALRRATTSLVLVQGATGTGKSCLANAIAVQTAQAGLSCLLVGASRELEKPLSYRAARPCHPILADRAQVSDRPISRRNEIDPVDARGRLDPAAMQLAMRVLRRARQLTEKYQLHPDEVELSLVAARPVPPAALDLLAVATDDASRIAQMLWSGNRRARCSLHDVETVIAGRSADVPPDEEPHDLIVADDSNFERKLASVLATRHRIQEEKDLSAVVSALRSPAPTDKTLREVHERMVGMTGMLRDAIDLVQDRGSLEAALTVEPRTHASRIVEFFVREHPGDGAAAAITFFRNLVRQFENDCAALAPYLEQHGARNVGSIAHAEFDRPSPAPSDYSSVASFVQKIREARYAARQLPGLLAQLRAIMPAPLMGEIIWLPLEKVAERIQADRIPDERARTAEELRQLRDLFASTGFGDLFAAPDDFLERSEALGGHPAQTAPSHGCGPA